MAHRAGEGLRPRRAPLHATVPERSSVRSLKADFHRSRRQRFRPARGATFPDDYGPSTAARRENSMIRRRSRAFGERSRIFRHWFPVFGEECRKARRCRRGPCNVSRPCVDVPRCPVARDGTSVDSAGRPVNVDGGAFRPPDRRGTATEHREPFTDNAESGPEIPRALTESRESETDGRWDRSTTRERRRKTRLRFPPAGRGRSEAPIFQELLGILDSQLAGDELGEEGVAEGGEGAGFALVLGLPKPRGFQESDKTLLEDDGWCKDGNAVEIFARYAPLRPTTIPG